MKKEQKKRLVLCLIFFFLWGCLLMDVQAKIFFEEEENLTKEEMAWRAERDKEMRSPTSWLTVAGLFWLEEGENSFGSSPSNRIKLPEGSSPSCAGKFIFNNGKITVVSKEGVELKIRDKIVTQAVLKRDDSGEPDVVALNDLRMWVIKRDSKYAIRLRDLNNPPYKNYKGLDFFLPSKKFKIEADFVSYPTPQKVLLETMIKTQIEMISPGYVTFKIDGQIFRLDAFQGDPKNKTLFFVFKDETNGKETYEASRFMESKILNNRKVDLNFNRAYNPPCAFTPFATCPLPPPQNHLNIRIEAGEKKYSGDKQ